MCALNLRVFTLNVALMGYAVLRDALKRPSISSQWAKINTLCLARRGMPAPRQRIDRMIVHLRRRWHG
jgi:hypothetical protein